MKHRVALCGLLLLCSCTTPLYNSHKEQSSHYLNIVEDGFLIGGVTSTTQHLLTGVRTHYANILFQVLHQERPVYRLKSAGALENSLGKKAYHTLLNRYRNHGALSTKDLEKIARYIQQYRYIAFARIESNRLTNQRYISEQPFFLDDESQQKVLDYTNRTETWQSSRTMNVQIHVYDLQTRTLAWSGLISKVGKSANQYTQQIHRHDNIKTLVLQHTELRQYPKNVSTGRVLQWVMESFVENMPRQDG